MTISAAAHSESAGSAFPRLIFIIGGYADGQDSYAKTAFPNARILTDYHETIRRQLLCGQDPMREAERLLVFRSETAAGSYAAKQNAPSAREDILSSAPNHPETLVICSREIGWGIVPVDAFERAWREVTGRVHCYLAKEANEVIRMVCGLPQILKTDASWREH